MSVTVTQLLDVPALQGATVLAGQGGLSRIISGISVLETADPSLLVEEYFAVDMFLGGELIITSFINCLDDIDVQCANVHQMATLGAAGLIVFYVGVHLPQVDPRILEICNQTNFVLLQMPVGHWELRYSEVISDVMAMIFRDRAQVDGLVVEFLERISQLPPHHRTMNAMLQMVSHRLGTTLALFDKGGNLLNLAPFPQSKAMRLQELLQQGNPMELSKEEEFQHWRVDSIPVAVPNGSVTLFVLQEGSRLPHGVGQQLEELTRLCLILWDSHQEHAVVEELIAAIMQDDPLKMRRLAQIFHIDVASMEELWLIDGATPQQRVSLCPKIQNQFRLQRGDTIVGVYKERLLLLCAKPSTLEEAQSLTQELQELMDREGDGLTLCRCCGVNSTNAVEQAFVLHEETISLAKALFPTCRLFWKEDLAFVAHCWHQISLGQQAIAQAVAPLGCLKNHPDLLQTLSVYLLDGNSSVAETADLLYLHKNTVKYRLGQITQILGYSFHGFSQRMALYQAVAVERLLDTQV